MTTGDAASATPAATGQGPDPATALQLPNRANVRLLDSVFHPVFGQKTP